jgi:hypothetical protein
MKKTGAGQRSRRHSPLRSDLLQLSILETPPEVS